MQLAAVHAEEAAKSWETIEEDAYNWEQTVRRNESYYKRLTPEQMSYKLGELENHDVPGRVLDSQGMYTNQPSINLLAIHDIANLLSLFVTHIFSICTNRP